VTRFEFLRLVFALIEDDPCSINVSHDQNLRLVLHLTDFSMRQSSKLYLYLSWIISSLRPGVFEIHRLSSIMNDERKVIQNRVTQEKQNL
jgi:hypothetical protein